MPSETELEENYVPPEAHKATAAGGPLLNGTTVFAQWRDKCFYPGFIQEVVSFHLRLINLKEFDIRYIF